MAERTEAKEFDDTIQTNGYAACLDMISEGPIKGLVSGVSGIYIEQNSLGIPLNQSFTYQYTLDNFDQNTSLSLGGGNDGSLTFLGNDFSQIKYYIDSVDRKILRADIPVQVNINTETYPSISEIKVVIRSPRMFVQWDKSLLDLYNQTDAQGKLIYSREKSLVLRNSADKINGDTFQTPVVINYYLEGDGVKMLSGKWTLNQKSTSEFAVQFRLTPTSSVAAAWKTVKNFKLKITRATFDSATTKIADDVYLENIICISNLGCLYPNSAIIGLKFDAKDFQSFPNRQYLCDMRIVDVPSNYFPPSLRLDGTVSVGPHYEGPWDGTFKKSWTNNPAWIFNDMCTNKRYGAGQFITQDKIDKWTLYLIGRYCDAVNDNGVFAGVAGDNGTVEQRFTCNLLLTSREDAYTVLNNLASVFRGMCYWNNNILSPVQDKLRVFTYQFTNANVVDGDFQYSTSEEKERPTVALIRWNDPLDFYSAKTERYEDSEGILKYGVNETQVAAFGCTSRTQASRVGRWMISTELHEREFVKYKVSLDGLLVRPGDIVRIQDNYRADNAFGGRIYGVDQSTGYIILDRLIDFSAYPSGWKISFSINSANTEAYDQTTMTEADAYLMRTRQVVELPIATWTTVDGKSAVSISYSYDLSNFNTFTITNTSDTSPSAKLYRLMGIKEQEDSLVELTALEYYEKKFSDDTNLATNEIPPIDYSDYPINPPSNLKLNVYPTTPSYLTYTFTASPGAFVDKYLISGKYASDFAWVDISANPKINWYKNDTYMVKMRAMQMGGKLSSEISNSAFFRQVPVSSGSNFLVKKTMMQLVNTDLAGEFTPPSPFIQFASDPQATSPSYIEPEAFYVRITDRATATVALDWTVASGASAHFGKSYQITGGQFLDHTVTGWPFRSMYFETKSFAFGKYSDVQGLFASNSLLGGETIYIANATPGNFDFHIINPAYDYSGIYIEVASGISTGIYPSYSGFFSTTDGHVAHGLTGNAYITYKPYDTFIYNENESFGPYSVTGALISGGAALTTGWNLFLSGGTVGSTTYMMGYLDVSFPILPGSGQYYEVEVSGVNNGFLSYAVPNVINATGFYGEPARSGRFMNVPIGDTYYARVKSIDSTGMNNAISAWSPSFPLTNSRGFDFAAVKMSGVLENIAYEAPTITGSEPTGIRYLDMSVSNYIRVQYSTTGSVSIIPSGYKPNATYFVTVNNTSTGQLVLTSDWYSNSNTNYTGQYPTSGKSSTYMFVPMSGYSGGWLEKTLMSIK